MKTVSIRLEDSVYEELEVMLDELDQTEQAFYETNTKTALEEWCSPFHRNAESSDTKMNAFERPEVCRIKVTEVIGKDSER